jgi:hypothetical protein
MMKLITVFLTVTIFVTGTMQAQSLPQPAMQNQSNLKQVFAEETEKLKAESATLDAKKLEKIERQNAPKKGWTTKSKVLIIVTVAALVGLAIILAANTKRCVKRSPSGCNFADDINCQCLEYAE